MAFNLATAQPVTPRFDLSTATRIDNDGAPSKPEPPTPGEAAFNASPEVGAVETGAHFLSSLAAFPIQAGASIYQLLKSKPGTRVANANKAISDVGDAMIYQPRTGAGQDMTGVGDTAMGLYPKLADMAGDKVTAATGSAGAGAATTTAIQAIPVLFGAGRASARASANAADAATAAKASALKAKDYVDTRTHLDWHSLSTAFQQKLADIAKNYTSLDNLDPTQVERQARLDKLGVTYTRGNVTRNLADITTEENLSRSEAGQPLRDVATSQDAQLHGLLDQLRGSGASTPQGVGQSVQGAVRGKLASRKAIAREQYDAARADGEMAAPVDPQPLKDWFSKVENADTVPSLLSSFKKYVPDEGQGISINDLEAVRKKASLLAKGQDTTRAHFAGQAIKVIDNILDGAPGQKYRKARSTWRSIQQEFKDPRLTRKLANDAKGSSDPQIALEDTFDQVILRGSKDQLATLKNSLTTGGDVTSRTNGVNAWRNLQSATIDYLKQKASGVQAVPGEKGQLQFKNASEFLKSLHDLDADGKLDGIFGIQKARALRSIGEAVRDVRTKPDARISGSPTAANLVNAIERVTRMSNKIPGGDMVKGAVNLIKNVKESGRQEREVDNSLVSPVDEANTNALRSRAAARRSNSLRRYGTAPAVAASEER